MSYDFAGAGQTAFGAVWQLANALQKAIARRQTIEYEVAMGETPDGTALDGSVRMVITVGPYPPAGGGEGA